jgi:hypothetical protein
LASRRWGRVTVDFSSAGRLLHHDLLSARRSLTTIMISAGDSGAGIRTPILRSRAACPACWTTPESASRSVVQHPNASTLLCRFLARHLKGCSAINGHRLTRSVARLQLGYNGVRGLRQARKSACRRLTFSLDRFVASLLGSGGTPRHRWTSTAQKRLRSDSVAGVPLPSGMNIILSSWVHIGISGRHEAQRRCRAGNRWFVGRSSRQDTGLQ